MSQENVEIVRHSIDAFSKRDFETLRTLYRAVMEVDWSASRGLEAGVYRGWAEIMRFYQGFLEMFEVEIEPDRFIESGDSVIVPNTGHNRGRDGIETVARSAFLFEIRSGRIARLCPIRKPAKPSTPPGCGSRSR